MKKDQKQAELEKNLAIVLATLDYLLKIHGGTIVYDDVDYIGEYYEQQKVQAQKYFNLRRLDKLEKQLHRSLQSTKGQDVQKATKYLKEHSGYHIDILAEEKKHVEEVINKGRIDSKEESHAVSFMLGTNKIAKEEKQKIKKLHSLLGDFHQKVFEAEKFSSKPQRGYTEIIKTEEKDGVIIEHFISSTGPKPSHFKEREEMSPDGKRKLKITEVSYSGHSSTSVNIVFEKVTGCPFSVSGILPYLNAFWKDNNTIVIEKKKIDNPNAQNKKIRSFNDTIIIEYIES